MVKNMRVTAVDEVVGHLRSRTDRPRRAGHDDVTPNGCPVVFPRALWLVDTYFGTNRELPELRPGEVVGAKDLVLVPRLLRAVGVPDDAVFSVKTHDFTFCVVPSALDGAELIQEQRRGPGEQSFHFCLGRAGGGAGGPGRRSGAGGGDRGHGAGQPGVSG